MWVISIRCGIISTLFPRTCSNSKLHSWFACVQDFERPRYEASRLNVSPQQSATDWREKRISACAPATAKQSLVHKSLKRPNIYYTLLHIHTLSEGCICHIGTWSSISGVVVSECQWRGVVTPTHVNAQSTPHSRTHSSVFGATRCRMHEWIWTSDWKSSFVFCLLQTN